MATFIGALLLPCLAAWQVVASEIEKTPLAGVTNSSTLSGSAGFGGTQVGFGGATQPSAMESIKKAGYASVINLRLDSEEEVALEASRAAAESAGLTYIHLPFDVTRDDPLAVENFLATVATLANQPAYIHCGSATRAASLWMIGRVLKDGWSVDAASAEASEIALKPAEAIAFARRYLSVHDD